MSTYTISPNVLGSFLVTRAGQSPNYNQGLITGSGFSLVAEIDETGNKKIGVETDFVRTRSNADMNEQLPGANGIQGFTFVATTVQLKGIQKTDTTQSI